MSEAEEGVEVIPNEPEIDAERFYARMVRVEGDEPLPYRDSKNILTVGIGHNLSVPLGVASRKAIFWEDVANAAMALHRYCPWWTQLDQVRREVVLELMFNMGWGDGKRGLSTFTRTLQMIRDGRFEAAAAGLAASKWAKDVKPGRADPLVRAMRGGSWE